MSLIVLLWEGPRFRPLTLKERLVVHETSQTVLMQQFRLGESLSGDKYVGNDHPAVGTLLVDWSPYDMEGYGSVNIGREWCRHIWTTRCYLLATNPSDLTPAPNCTPLSVVGE